VFGEEVLFLRDPKRRLARVDTGEGDGDFWRSESRGYFDAALGRNYREQQNDRK
jgi:hypothetical protein